MGEGIRPPGMTIYPEEFPFGISQDLYDVLLKYAGNMDTDVRVVAQLAILSARNPYLKTSPIAAVGARLEREMRARGFGKMIDKLVGELPEDVATMAASWPPGHDYIIFHSRGRARRKAEELESLGYVTLMTRSPRRGDAVVLHYWPREVAPPGAIPAVAKTAPEVVEMEDDEDDEIFEREWEEYEDRESPDIGEAVGAGVEGVFGEIGKGLGAGVQTGIVLLIGLGVGGLVGLIGGVQLGRMWR